jgi:choline dehydrogenase-like flavoprotein
MNMAEKIYDAVIVGSGPGGATVARELSRAGKKVALLERGRDQKWLGNSLAALGIIDIPSVIPSFKRPMMIRALTTGGCSIVYCGTATPPPDWLHEKYGIDIRKESDETIEELSIGPLPDHLLGDAARRLMQAANELGFHWEPIKKFMNPDRCPSGFDCSSDCMLGCTCGAKWTAREYIEEAVSHGAELFTRTMVDKVLTEDGQAVGVSAKTRQGVREFKAAVTVLSAGGLGTPVILLRSGITSAGKKFFCDPLVMVYGISKQPIKGSVYDPPMVVGTYEHYDERIVLMNLTHPGLLLPGIMLAGRPSRFWEALQSRRALGVMVKVGDEMAGEIYADGTYSKPLQATEKKRLKKGTEISRKILIQAGADPDSIIVSPVHAAHPGGTARIGEVVDKNCETEIKNLFIADASVFPDTLDLPIVLMAISMSKRLSRHLLRDVFGSSQKA